MVLGMIKFLKSLFHSHNFVAFKSIQCHTKIQYEVMTQLSAFNSSYSRQYASEPKYFILKYCEGCNTVSLGIMEANGFIPLTMEYMQSLLVTETGMNCDGHYQEWRRK
jgi:hypothetical protein